VRRQIATVAVGTCAALTTSLLLLLNVVRRDGLSSFEWGFGTSLLALEGLSAYAFVGAALLCHLSHRLLRLTSARPQWLAVALGIASSSALWMLTMTEPLATRIGARIPWAVIPALASILSATLICGMHFVARHVFVRSARSAGIP